MSELFILWRKEIVEEKKENETKDSPTEKGFFEKWKEGIQMISPRQQAWTQLLGNWIILVGILLGIIISIYSGIIWLLIILIGAFINSVVSQIGIYQKYSTLKSMEESFK